MFQYRLCYIVSFPLDSHPAPYVTPTHGALRAFTAALVFLQSRNTGKYSTVEAKYSGPSL